MKLKATVQIEITAPFDAADPELFRAWIWQELTGEPFSIEDLGHFKLFRMDDHTEITSLEITEE